MSLFCWAFAAQKRSAAPAAENSIDMKKKRGRYCAEDILDVIFWCYFRGKIKVIYTLRFSGKIAPSCLHSKRNTIRTIHNKKYPATEVTGYSRFKAVAFTASEAHRSGSLQRRKSITQRRGRSRGS